MDDEVRAVEQVVRAIPAGRVLTYGDVAELMGRSGPRQVARVMASGVLDVAWWRVVRADGTLPSYLWDEACAQYLREGTPLGGERVDMRRARWAPALSDLGGLMDPW